MLAAGHEPDERTAESILQFTREYLAPCKRVRRLEFYELPKTIPGNGGWSCEAAGRWIGSAFQGRCTD
ncbi:hypothetical protein E1161_15960 [Saccharopolyspora aridisoli]|uniref:Uncharacterized protein n=1 Tax=Saccharopolyspora aridisoli TaxID=2530385 RepID=A0A4R4UII1_9PSEU|nr:hypothetical protein [Saccharopolyspora aridisoli]TDC91708.1 hypothetical protein E1161_15960 [Saccharopolyspora aridisoli]